MWFMKVGNRVMGPFDEDEMRAKRLCKELAPFHLVSRDGIRWESAAPLIKLLDGAQPEWKRPQPDEPARDKGRDSVLEFAPTPSVQWYYVDSSRKQLGPIPQEALRELLQTRRLSGRALACKVGDTQWEQARRYPELASSLPKGPGRPAIIATAATLGVSSLAAILIFFVIGKLPASQATGGDRWEPAQSTSGGHSEPTSRAGAILSIKDEAHLQKAIGLVVCGWNVRMKSGVVVDETGPSGTCFSISSDGLLLTNKHVVKEADKRQNMAEDFVLVDFILEKDAMPKGSQLYSELVRSGKVPKTADQETIKKCTFELALDIMKQQNLVQKYQAVVKDIKPRVWVFLGSRDDLYVAKVLYVSEQHDMAVLKIKAAELPFLRMAAQTELPTRGTDVFALGFPGTSRIASSREEAILDSTRKPQTIKAEFRDGDFLYVQTKGIVTKVFRENAGGRQWIQHEADINPGNSGGPLVTADCKVVAINTQFLRDERDAAATTQSLAVPQLLGEVSPYFKNGSEPE